MLPKLKVADGHYIVGAYSIIYRLQGDWAIYYRATLTRLSTHRTLKAALATARNMERPRG